MQTLLKFVFCAIALTASVWLSPKSLNADILIGGCEKAYNNCISFAKARYQKCLNGCTTPACTQGCGLDYDSDVESCAENYACCTGTNPDECN
jgi:hypothetical protein